MLLDPSLSVDLSKIDGILSLGDETFVDGLVRDVLFDRPVTHDGLSAAIDLNMTSRLSGRDVLTALFFMGFLTFSATDPGKLVCPNRAVKNVFFQYCFWRREHLQEVFFPNGAQRQAIERLRKGDLRPLLEFVSGVLGTSAGSHVHARLSETALRLAVFMAVNTAGGYRGTAEEEAVGAGFADLVLRPTGGDPTDAGWLIEFKCLRPGAATDEAAERKLDEAEARLGRDGRAGNIAGIRNLHRAAVVSAGTKLPALRIVRN